MTKHYSWFKFPHDLLLNDPHVGIMPDCFKVILVQVFCLASESETRGKIMLDPDQVASRLEISRQMWLEFVDLAKMKGWLKPLYGGYDFLLWDKTQ